MRIAALVPYHPGFCSGQRFRVELWAEILRPHGFEMCLYPFTNPRLTKILYQPGRRFQKARSLVRCYIDQVGRIVTAPKPDVVLIYREASLIGPALLERLTQRWKVPIIYDIDEPLFLPYRSPRNGRYNVLKCIGKTHSLFRLSHCVLAVNQAIAEYAGRLARDVRIVPMAVDTDRYAPATGQGREEGPIVGWTGTMTTQPHLQLLAEPLRRLRAEHDVRLRVIADEPMTLPGVDVDFHQWTPETEIPRLQGCQIGVVPVRPDSWSPWKFYFKLIQFMSLGLPVVATGVGSNLEIIEDGVNGFVVQSEEEWYDRLRLLLSDPKLRAEMGRSARRTAEETFSLSGQLASLAQLFEEYAEKRVVNGAYR